MEEHFIAGFKDELEKIAYGMFGTVGKTVAKPGFLKGLVGMAKKSPGATAAIAGTGAGAGLLLGRASKD